MTFLTLMTLTLGDNGSNIVDSEELLISSNQTSSMTLPAVLLFLLPVGVLLLGIGVTLCLHRKRIKQGLIQVGLHFSKTHEQGGLHHHQAPMVDITGRLECFKRAKNIIHYGPSMISKGKTLLKDPWKDRLYSFSWSFQGIFHMERPLKMV